MSISTIVKIFPAIVLISACSGGSTEQFGPECNSGASCPAPNMIFSGKWLSECGAFTVDFPSFAYGQISYEMQADQVSRKVWEYTDSSCMQLSEGFEILPTLNGTFSFATGTTITNIGEASNIDIQWNTFTALDVNGVEVVADDLTDENQITKDIWLVQGNQFYFGSTDPNVDDPDPVRSTELQSIVLTRTE